jgi:hypothetical protein
MTLVLDEVVELLEIQCRGSVATAFARADLMPTSSEWQMMRGDREITMRDLGEIGFKTDVKFTMSLLSREPNQDPEKDQ